MQSKGSSAIDFRHPQSSRLAVFGGREMSFNICRGTLGSLAMFTAMPHRGAARMLAPRLSK
jgi:hypothetical protein